MYQKTRQFLPPPSPGSNSRAPEYDQSLLTPHIERVNTTQNCQPRVVLQYQSRSVQRINIPPGFIQFGIRNESLGRRNPCVGNSREFHGVSIGHGNLDPIPFGCHSEESVLFLTSMCGIFGWEPSELYIPYMEVIWSWSELVLQCGNIAITNEYTNH